MPVEPEMFGDTILPLLIEDYNHDFNFNYTRYSFQLSSLRLVGRFSFE